MNQKKLFSIITPARNAVQKLASTHGSLLAQTSDLYEWIVVDGASTDQTTQWLEAHQNPSLRWISEPDQGVYDAMNKGIKLAQGQFLLFLGAGDRLVHGCLQRVAEWIARYPATDPRFIYGDVREMESGLPFTRGRFTKSKICRSNICHQGIFYEKSIFDLVGEYEMAYPIMADWVLNLRCFGDSRIRKIHFPEDVAEFEGGGLCSTTPDYAFARERRELIRRHLGAGYAWGLRLEEAIRRRLPNLSQKAKSSCV